MLKITLYKNCKISDNYQNVLSTGINTSINKSPLEEYLETLTSEVIELNSVYQDFSGTFIFDYELLNSKFYEYNYLKIETLDNEEVKIKRYCFIQSIKLVNELIYIGYKEDYWHSYSDKINGINKSLLVNSRRLTFGSSNIYPYTLPLDYNGNDAIIWETLDDNSGKFYVLFEIQRFKAVPEGEISLRFTDTGILCTNEGNEEEYSYNEAITIIENIMLYQPKGRFKSTVTVGENTDYYEIINFYIIPTNYFSNYYLSSNLYEFGIFTDEEATEFYNIAYAKKFDFLYRQSGTVVTSKRITLNNDFKTISIGTFLKQIPIESNGTNRDIELLHCITKESIKFFINANNRMIEITDELQFNLPFDSETSEKFNRAKLTRETALSNLKLQNISNALSFSQKEIGRMFSMGKTDFQIFKNGFSDKNVPLSLNNQQQLINMGFDTANLIVNTKKLSNDIKLLNGPTYTSNFSVNVNNSNVLTTKYGLVKFKVNSDNDAQVENLINLIGYNVYFITDNFSQLGINNPTDKQSIIYDVLRFSTISIYGLFSMEIAKILELIFENGVRIFYKGSAF